MDTAVAAYLLDPSTGDYRLDARSRRRSSPARSRSTDAVEPQGQLALDGTDRAIRRRRSARSPRPAWSPSWSSRSAARWRPPGMARPARRGGAPAGRGAGPHGGGRHPGGHRRAAPHRPTSWSTDARALEAEIHELAGHEFNVNSTPQLRTVLYDELGLTPGPQDQDRLLDRRGHARGAARRTTRSSRPCCATGRWRSSAPPTARACWPRWRPTAASTPRSARRWPAPGRLSSERPNLHNIPVRTDAGQAVPAGLRAGRGLPVPGGRLRPDRAAGDRPPLRRPRAGRGLRLGRRHPPGGGRRRLRGPGRGGRPGPSGSGPRWSPTASPTGWRPTAWPGACRPGSRRPPRS